MIIPFAFVSIGLAVLAPLGIHIMAGSKFNESIPLLRIMSPIPLVVAIGACFATFFMLGLGYKKQWGNLIISASAFNFVVLVPLIFLTRATYAVAVTSVAVEGFVAAASYWFWLRHEAD